MKKLIRCRCLVEKHKSAKEIRLELRSMKTGEVRHIEGAKIVRNGTEEKYDVGHGEQFDLDLTVMWILLRWPVAQTILH